MNTNITSTDQTFDKIIDTTQKLVTALNIYSKHILPLKDKTIIGKKYVDLIRKYYPSLKSMKKKDIEKKIDYLIERIYFLEYLREGCHKHKIYYHKNELDSMTNDEIEDEADYLLGNDYIDSDSEKSISCSTCISDCGCNFCDESSSCSICPFERCSNKRYPDISSEIIYTSNMPSWYKSSVK